MKDASYWLCEMLVQTSLLAVGAAVGPLVMYSGSSSANEDGCLWR